MATNFTSTTQGGQREDLANWISNISRDMTPFVSSIGKGKASATLHEWSTDTLEAASVQAAAEGASFVESASPVVARVTNRTQILTKGIRVSGTLEAVDKVGRKSEFKYQTEKRGKEMARDLEVIMLSGQVSSVHGSSATGNIQALARKMGAYQSYSTVNIVAGTAAAATGTGAVTGAGDGSNIAVAQTAHTNANVTLADINEVLRLVNGVTSVAPNKLMMSTTNKVRFSDLMTGTTNVRRNIDEKGKLRQSVDLYESDFGDVELVHNYLMGNTEIFVYDPSTMSINTLRPLHFRDISEDGDSLRSFMVQELTFEAKTPTGNAVILDVTA
uniref:Major capsid protein n=1 Tax=Virus NIOZ-UU157 TaxID=2763269 RepID=A0A7S9SSM0_9VIRU|nr:MAG: major capsid protein [Virus NIOZ-UU157]